MDIGHDFFSVVICQLTLCLLAESAIWFDKSGFAQA